MRKLPSEGKESRERRGGRLHLVGKLKLYSDLAGSGVVKDGTKGENRNIKGEDLAVEVQKKDGSSYALYRLWGG